MTALYDLSALPSTLAMLTPPAVRARLGRRGGGGAASSEDQSSLLGEEKSGEGGAGAGHVEDEEKKRNRREALLDEVINNRRISNLIWLFAFVFKEWIGFVSMLLCLV